MDEKVIYLISGTIGGWFLGLFSPLISTAIQQIFQSKQIKQAILNELNELKFRAAMNVEVLSPHYFPYNRAFLTWLFPYLEEFDNLYPGKTICRGTKAMLELTDDQINAYADMKIAEKPNPTYHLKSFSLPYLDSHIASVGFFSEEFQRKLLEVRTQISLLNEEIAKSQYYFDKTFDNLTPENHTIISNNLSDCYIHVARMLRRVVDKIDKLKDD
jgi:hypothetical protein